MILNVTYDISTDEFDHEGRVITWNTRILPGHLLPHQVRALNGLIGWLEDAFRLPRPVKPKASHLCGD